MDGKRRFSRCQILILAVLLHFTAAKETEIRAHAGTNVTLPCRVDIQQCGTLHSVKWYRDTSRIYVFSKAGQVARAEGDATERMSVQYDEAANETLLKVSPVEVEDEAIYKCEITYMEVRENCDVVQIVKLTTLVKPASVRILSNDGVSISNSTRLKPKNEGSEIEVICEAMDGKPIPTVSWYNGSQLMNRASYSTHGNNNGVGTGVSKLHLTLSRGDLNARFECRVSSQALDEPIVSWITVDVNVKPTRIEVSGVSGYVVQGATVLLMCDVFEARPAATVKWFNGTQEINDTRLIQTIPEENRDGGTFTTKSSLVFTATRWENGRTFKCIEENEVTKSTQLPGLYAIQVLDVRFPPVIKVNAAKTVVNESEKVMLSCTYYANPQKLTGATWLKDGKNLTKIIGKHENGDIESPSLHIRNITREDMGEYTCWLKNDIGESVSEESIYLDVHYPPDVEVIMEPSTPVKAVDRGNVTLECNVTSGNPPALRKVRWFLGGELMTELPECNYSQPMMNETLGGPFCGIDPSILSLIKVEESFSGNYTCQGENEAGYGPESEPQELIVYYPPTPAKLRYYPSVVIKKAAVILECTVDHPGRPENVTYLWFRGGYRMGNITVSNWTIPEASLATRTNFTCIATNEGGQSTPATVSIKVLAPPAFIGTLNSYKGVLYSSTNVSLTCRIECFPLCSIIWFKDGYRLNTHNNPLYYVNNTIHSADYSKNDFESIESTLVWNISNWPNQQLNKSAPPSQYTCASISSHDVGSHVNFTTEIAIDFPPEDLTATKRLVNVIENEIPVSVKCSGKGRPKLNYIWKKNLTSEPIIKDDTLQLDKMSRSDAGSYICEAYNKYGNQSIQVLYNVQYKPDCSIEATDRDGESALVCIANANPQEVSFSWKIRESNDTIDYDNIISEGLRSYLILDSSVDTYRTYQCIANNTVGASIPCERYVLGSKPWYKRLGSENLIIIIASIIALIICVIIVCIVIIVLCRKKREHSKCNNPLEMEEREKPDGHSPDTSGQSKWPLRPGVLVHVGKMNNVNISQLSPDITPFKTTSVSRSSAFLTYKRNKSKFYARLQRLRDILGFGERDRIPSGITEGASGVVTYKKIKPTSPPDDCVNPRKRKKPGFAPNPSSIEDKARLGAAPAPLGGSADPANDHDKGFYENLPFHGMQNPPNKPISVIAPFTQGINTTSNLHVSAKCVNNPTAFIPCRKVQRHQSFHGFQQVHNNPANCYSPRFTFNRNLSNPYLNNPSWPTFTNVSQRHPLSLSGVQPLLNFNPILLPNPFSIPPRPNRVVGRRESDIRRTASGINVSKNETPQEINTGKCTSAIRRSNSADETRFGSLELKKHKCYSPTFYSMRCKKHAKRRPVVYALPKKVFGDINSDNGNLAVSNKKFSNNLENSDRNLPVPAPRCKKHKTREIIYQNISHKLQEAKNNKNSSLNVQQSLDASNSSNDGSENIESEVSITEAQVHHTLSDDQKPKLVGVSPKPNVVLNSSNNIIRVDGLKSIKNSPTLKVSPNFIKPKTESPKGALSLQIQAKRKSLGDNVNSLSDDIKENLPLIPQQMPLLDTQNKWSPSKANSNQANNLLHQPYRPDFNDFVYADVESKYGPIDYKGASIYAAMKRNKDKNNKLEEVRKPYDDLL